MLAATDRAPRTLPTDGALGAMAITGASSYGVILFMVTAVRRFLGVIAMVPSPMEVVAVMACMGIGGIIALARLPPSRSTGSMGDWRGPVVDALSPGPCLGRPGQKSEISRR